MPTPHTERARIRPRPEGFPEPTGTAEAMAMLRESGPSARDRIVSAAVDCMSDLTPALLLSAVGTRTIAKRAGVSTALVFHHFGSVDELARVVIGRIFDPGTVPVAEVNSTIDALAQSALPVDASMAMHHNEFERVRRDPELRLRLGVWALGGADADTAYGRYLAEIDTRLEPLLAKLLRSWGRELRPPWTPRTYIAAHSSMLVSAVIRNMVDPERSDVSAFSRAAASMSMISMRVIGDRHTVDDRLGEINYYPLRRGTRTVTDIAGRRRALLLHTAAEHFGIRGFAATKMAQIARAAGVSESTLYAQFESKSCLAAELFDKQAVDALTTASRADTSTDTSERLQNAVITLAKATRTHTDFAAPYLTELVVLPSRRTPGAVVGALARLLPDRFEADDVDAADDAAELATILAIATVRRVLARPAHLPDVVAHYVLTRHGFQIDGT